MLQIITNRINRYFPEAFPDLQGYDDFHCYLRGSIVQQVLIYTAILLGSTFSTLLIFLSAEMVGIILIIGFLFRDYALAVCMTFAAREHYRFWNNHPDIFQNLAVTPIPSKIIPTLIRSSLLKRAFFLIVVSMVIEFVVCSVIMYTKTTIMYNDLSFLFYYCLVSPFLMAFHFQTAHLVTSIFLPLTLQRANYLMMLFKGVAYLVFVTGLFTIFGIILTITVWAIVGSIVGEMRTGQYGSGPEMIYVLAGILTMAPIFLLCSYLKYITSNLQQKRFLAGLEKHIRGE